MYISQLILANIDQEQPSRIKSSYSLQFAIHLYKFLILGGSQVAASFGVATTTTIAAFATTTCKQYPFFWNFHSPTIHGQKNRLY